MPEGKRLKFSIITPSFNQGRYLNKTIKSVVSQKGPFDIEYIIIDGGSTDNSVAVIKKYASQFSCISWQSCSDNGQVSAINKGLKKAHGDIIAYINSDDYYLPQAFNKVQKYFLRHPEKKWVVGDCQVTKKSLRWTFFLKRLWPIHKLNFALKVFDTINQPSVFLTKKLVNKVGYFDEKYQFAFDYDYWLRCHREDLPGRIHHYLSVFRIHKQSKGSTAYSTQFREDLQIAQLNTFNLPVLLIHHLARTVVLVAYRILK